MMLEKRYFRKEQDFISHEKQNIQRISQYFSSLGNLRFKERLQKPCVKVSMILTQAGPPQTNSSTPETVRDVSILFNIVTVPLTVTRLSGQLLFSA